MRPVPTPNMGPLVSGWSSRTASYGSPGRIRLSGRKMTASLSTKWPIYLIHTYIWVLSYMLRMAPILSSVPSLKFNSFRIVLLQLNISWEVLSLSCFGKGERGSCPLLYSLTVFLASSWVSVNRLGRSYVTQVFPFWLAGYKYWEVETGKSATPPPPPPGLQYSGGHCSFLHFSDSTSPRLAASPGQTQQIFFFSYIFFFFFCICTSVAPQRPAHGIVSSQVATHLRTDRVCPVWGGAGSEPRTTDLQSGVLPLSHFC